MAWFLISNFSGRRKKAKHYLICDLQSTELAMQGQPQRLFAVNLRCCSARVELPSEKLELQWLGHACHCPRAGKGHMCTSTALLCSTGTKWHRDKTTQEQSDTGIKWHSQSVQMGQQSLWPLWGCRKEQCSSQLCSRTGQEDWIAVLWWHDH